MVILQQRNMTPASIVRVVASIRFPLYHHILPVNVLLFNTLSLPMNMSPLPPPAAGVWLLWWDRSEHLERIQPSTLKRKHAFISLRRTICDDGNHLWERLTGGEPFVSSFLGVI